MPKIPIRVPDNANDYKPGCLFYDTEQKKIIIYTDNHFRAYTHGGDIAEELARVDLSNVDDNVILTKLTNVDGSGSGLDADTLDGLHATDFVQQDSAGNVTITGSLDVGNNLTVQNLEVGNNLTVQNLTVQNLEVIKPFPSAIPKDSIAYFKKQLIDEIIGIKPDGYDGSTVTSYGLRTSSDNATLVVTERKDDVPFEGVVSFAVEEGTTNILPNPSFEEWSGDMPTNWAKGSNVTIEQVPGRRPNSYAVRFSSSSGGNVDVNRLRSAWGIFQPDTTYTISFYARRISGEGSLAIAIDGTGVFYPTQGIDNRWQRFSVTLTTARTTYTAFGFFPTQANDVFEIDDVQVEQKPFPTSFVDGTRPEGRLAIPINFRTNLVISGWFKPYGTSGNYGTHGGWARLVNFSNSDDTRRVTLAYNRNDSHPNFRKFVLDIYNASGDAIVTTSNVYPFNKWYFWVLIIEDASTTAYIFDENGNMEKIVNTNSIPISVISSSPLYIGHRTVGTTDVLNGVISNLLIARYDPATWTDEYIRFLYETQKPFYV